jgi:hypothetical protein
MSILLLDINRLKTNIITYTKNNVGITFFKIIQKSTTIKEKESMSNRQTNKIKNTEIIKNIRPNHILSLSLIYHKNIKIIYTIKKLYKLTKD